jgi:hypothetical protein
MDASLKYDSFNATDQQINKTGGDVKYAMVPVWILTTKFDGKPYTFMMNGQTGKFIGSLPTDKGKENKYMAMAFGAVLVAAVIIINVVSADCYKGGGRNEETLENHRFNTHCCFAVAAIAAAAPVPIVDPITF